MPTGLRAGHHTYWKDAGAGPKRAVLIHCSLAHSGAWGGVITALGDAYRSCAFDMPGHGRSAGYVGDDYQGQTAAIAATFCDGPTHLIGHSFGATVVLRLAAQQPHLVSRLSLIEPVFFAAASPEEQEAHEQQMQPFARMMAQDDLRGAAAFFNGLWGALPWDKIPQSQQDYMAQRIHLIPMASASIMQDSHGLLDGGLSKIDAPVDLIAGSHSHPIIPSILDGLTRQFPHAKRVTIQGAGHMVPITHATEVTKALTDEV
ncbi:alpha/beta fold hydrolase [Nereida sp. MMG025]|uniref:alpha/beta fold hydrolase n=1 Tax=Nereida sp. MMG025 TaxID=2909981 RepID=UPI001F3F1C41|nr:alpha/beta hydrolase [Nereida sp. MMG025]MCF6444104.1 alpha/beta hydrolase [Nereida sp. MMG025]